MTGLGNCNDDVLVEILLRLPTKSLIKLKSVCRRWLRLISSDEFCRLHTLRPHKPPPSLILRCRHSDLFYYFRPFSDAPKFVPFILPHPKVVSSCNGLLLLQSENHNCHVYNPATKQSRKIGLSKSHDYPHILGLNLAFDPSLSPHYKIVCVRAANERTHCKIEVYDSVSREWKICSESLTARSTDAHYFATGVHWNDAIHWGRSYAPPHLCFNTSNDVVRVIPRERIPFRVGVGCRHQQCHVQESNGCLYYIDITLSEGHASQQSVAVYELQQDYSEWSFKYHFVLGRVPRNCRILNYDGETDTLVIHVPGQILAYRFHGRSFEQLVDMTKQPSYREDSLLCGYRTVYHFGETLALV